MCCGCYRMMAPDGKPLAGMRMNAQGIPEPLAKVTAEDIAWFSSKDEGNEAAAHFGWSTEDREGPNHRCPDCIAAEKRERRKEREQAAYAGQVERRGAFVNREDLGL